MKEILSVTELTERIRDLLESGFDVLQVEGEVSNLRRPGSGHIYFTLKDDKSAIRAVLFRSHFPPFRQVGSAQLQAFELEEGMRIVCRGRLGVYQARGEYQLIVEKVEPQGLGALQKAFEQLKARLAAEGLFDAEKKKPIPFLPARIGVVTSPTGAVIRDILTVTRRRFSSVNILVAPVRVQGPEAPREIAAALRLLQSMESIDVIIVARGGGSLEDLAPFNDEAVARAIFACPVPVISAVGHETDFTIADFVADLRAPTPSAAAELAVPSRTELAGLLKTLRRRLVLAERGRRQTFADRLDFSRQRLRDPKRRIAEIRMDLDGSLERIRQLAGRCVETARRNLGEAGLRLRYRHPAGRIGEGRIALEQRKRNMVSEILRFVERNRNTADGLTALLQSLSPLAVLNRGYAIVRTVPGGRIVRRPADARCGEDVDMKLASGGLRATVKELYEESDHGQGEI
ncbi:MAG: Exodeoxyribonuclease 7 large subunit [Syntrophaceae bacterium PtaU1.Bin231]|nr:MAG: Exodeoxyribonuclease 7 large subunit [Syntrophaceae bacterium PtaU1.Bin231]